MYPTQRVKRSTFQTAFSNSRQRFEREQDQIKHDAAVSFQTITCQYKAVRASSPQRQPSYISTSPQNENAYRVASKTGLVGLCAESSPNCNERVGGPRVYVHANRKHTHVAMNLVRTTGNAHEIIGACIADQSKVWPSARSSGGSSEQWA